MAAARLPAVRFHRQAHDRRLPFSLPDVAHLRKRCPRASAGFMFVQGDAIADDIGERGKIDDHIKKLCGQGLRCICFAVADGPGKSSVPFDFKTNELDDYDVESMLSKLTYLGIAALYDPPRPESRGSVHLCQGAGICVRMLTGDHQLTASTIAKTLGIIADDPLPGQVMIGVEFEKLSDEELDALPDLPRVLGRCSPSAKVRMIDALHRRGKVVAMTGDGFNDSPSIKKADVGCAMGSGTDVTKSVADLVITDGQFCHDCASGRRGAAHCFHHFKADCSSSQLQLCRSCRPRYRAIVPASRSPFIPPCSHWYPLDQHIHWEPPRYGTFARSDCSQSTPHSS